MIKNLLTSSALVLSFTLISFNAKAQENDINVMKQQSEVLKLNADLMHKKAPEIFSNFRGYILVFESLCSL